MPNSSCSLFPAIAAAGERDSDAAASRDPAEIDRATLDVWEQRLIPAADGHAVLLRDVAQVLFAPAPRRGMFEKEGSEAVAGIVHLRYGHNPLNVTQRVKERLIQLAEGLPSGVRIVPCYDRTALITGNRLYRHSHVARGPVDCRGVRPIGP